MAARRERLHHGPGGTHLLREVMRVHQLLMAGFAREVGRPSSQFALMRLLVPAEEGLGVVELARTLGVDAAAVTRQVQEMEREGLLVRRADLRDRRRSYVRLSAKGFRLFEAIHARSHELERALAALVGRDLAAALRALEKMRRYLEEMSVSGAKGSRS